MSLVVDGRGRAHARVGARRIVSLVPSTTESVFVLGAGDSLVGRTRFCVSPPDAARVAVVGGTKDVDVDRVLALNPDLVLANCEENTREVLDALSARVPVYAGFPRDVDRAIVELDHLAELLGADAPEPRRAITDARAAARAQARPFRFAWLIWRRPYMVAGADTFISAVLADVGGTNVFAGRYPSVTAEAIRAADPDVVLLSSEPFPFGPDHVREISEASGLAVDRIFLSDGTFTWHGTRMRHTFEQLAVDLPRWCHGHS